MCVCVFFGGGGGGVVCECFCLLGFLWGFCMRVVGFLKIHLKKCVSSTFHLKIASV